MPATWLPKKACCNTIPASPVAAPAATPAAPDTAVVVPPAPARSPGYYVRQRLWANRPAVAGLVFIGLCALVALLGYWILPDPSPDANNGLVQLQKQPPGFTTAIRQVPDPNAPPPANLLQVWLRGRPPQLKDEPADTQQVTNSPAHLITRTYWLGTDKAGRDELRDRKSTRLNSSHPSKSRMPSSA